MLSLKPFVLDPQGLETLRSVAVDFCITFIVVSLIGAILLQAAHEGLRSYYNKFAIDWWLNLRQSKLGFRELCDEMDGSSRALLSLPYWQLTGQINAAVSSQLNLYPASKLVDVFANIDPDYGSRISHQLELRGVSEQREAAILRDVAARAQAGINSLHARLRIAWAMFDYYLTLLVTGIIAGLMTTVVSTQGQRFLLYTIAVFSWLATPIIRRIIEILVPFR
jgi:hypothetical protein